MSEISELNKALEPYCLKSTLDKDLGDVNSILHPHPYERKYEELEWIEVKGDNYVDLGIPAQNNIKIEIKFELTKIAASQFLFGFTDEYVSPNHRLFGPGTSYQDGKHWCFGYDTNYYNPRTDNVKVELDIPYVMEVNFANGSQSLIIDGIEVITGSLANNINYTQNLALFGLYGRPQGTSSYSYRNLSNAKLYYFKLWKDNVLIRDIIPIIFGSSSVALLDKIENKLYYGNKSFIYYKIK